MEAKKLYRVIVEQELALRSILRTKPSESRDAQAIRNIIAEKALALVSIDAVYAASKDIEQFLWKPCFYQRIEDFRKKIRKYAAASATDTAARSYLHKVCVAFGHFLNEACNFYEQLLHYFRKHLTEEASKIMPQDRMKCQQSCHRSLIFLGDLSRYRELHSESSKKDWSTAEGFYHQALAVIPDKGNPHNQLAVLATYIDAECVAVYRYWRSLMVAHPFATAEENLALLFEKNRQRSYSSTMNLSNAKDKSVALKQFLHRFVRLHGSIFSMLKKEPPTPIPLDSHVSVCQDLEKLLNAGAIGDALLLKMIIICISATVRSTKCKVLEEPEKSYAYTVAFSVATKVVEMLNAKSLVLPSSHGERSDALLPSYWRLLGPLGIFCDWIRLDPPAMEFATAHELTEESQDTCQYLFWKAISVLLSKLNGIEMSFDDNLVWKEKTVALKEYFELRGFLPLVNTAQLYGQQVMMPTASLPDDQALNVRIYKLLDFGHAIAEQKNRCLEFTGMSFVLPSISSLEVADDKTCSGLFQQAPQLDEDPDDEVIVFQPSFSRRASGISSLPPSSERSMLFGQVGSSAFSIPYDIGEEKVAGNATTSPNPKYASNGIHGTSYSMFGGMDGSSFSDSASMSNSFSMFPSFDWGSVGTSSFATASSASPLSHFGTDPASDLAALERESERYGSASSSLSMLSSPFTSSTYAGNRRKSAPNVQRNRPSPPRPPPGFNELEAPPGFLDPVHGATCSTSETGSPADAQLYTTNPFIIGNG